MSALQGAFNSVCSDVLVLEVYSAKLLHYVIMGFSWERMFSGWVNIFPDMVLSCRQCLNSAIKEYLPQDMLMMCTPAL